jgi:hypothetical protein
MPTSIDAEGKKSKRARYVRYGRPVFHQGEAKPCSKLDAWPVAAANPRLSPRELDQIVAHSAGTGRMS